MLRLALSTVLCLCAFAATACKRAGADAPPKASAESSAQGGVRGSVSGFASRGGDACGKYLTPAVVSSILNGTPGPAKKLSAQGCEVETVDHGGSISITLNAASPQAFDAYQKYLSNPTPLAGVGDRAVQSMTGISSIKGSNEGCDVDAGGAPGSLKLHGAALGAKLGDICNRIYADAK